MSDKTDVTSELVRTMYPKALDKYPTFVSYRDEMPTIGEIAAATKINLDGLCADQPRLGSITHEAKVLIQALQNELKIAEEMIVSLKTDLDAAESTFAETCDCDDQISRCGACEQGDRLRLAVKSAEQSIERIKLTRV